MIKLIIFNTSVPCDVSTFTFRGHVAYTKDNHKKDARISFSLPIQSDETNEEVVIRLIEALGKDITTANDRVHIVHPAGGGRPIIAIKLPSGMSGIANPSYFSFK